MTKRKQEAFIVAMNLRSAREARKRSKVSVVRKGKDISMRHILCLCVRSARVHHKRPSASETRDAGPNEP